MEDIWVKICMSGVIISLALLILVAALQELNVADIWKKIILSTLAVSVLTMFVAAICAVWF